MTNSSTSRFRYAAIGLLIAVLFLPWNARAGMDEHIEVAQVNMGSPAMPGAYGGTIRGGDILDQYFEGRGVEDLGVLQERRLPRVEPGPREERRVPVPTEPTRPGNGSTTGGTRQSLLQACRAECRQFGLEFCLENKNLCYGR